MKYGIRDREAGNIIKSNIETYEEAERILAGYEEADRFQAGADRYAKLIEFCKVKGVRVGLKKATIEKKIADAGLVVNF